MFVTKQPCGQYKVDMSLATGFALLEAAELLMHHMVLSL